MRSGALDPAVAKARRLVREALPELGPGDRLVVAVSGGADSLALAAVVAFVASREHWLAEAVVVDHGLQPGSGEVARRAAGQCAALGLDSHVVAVRVEPGGGPEAAARRARYAALEAHADTLGPNTPILVAHTLDDQAETVLLGLGRGSGGRSLAGIAVRRGRVVRPFLALRRHEARAVCVAHALVPWDDPHNADPAYQRVRIRHEVLPLMDEVLGGGVAEALARTADQLARDADFLDLLAVQWLADSEGGIGVAEAADLHPAVRSRVLRAAALAAGAAAGELSAGHVAELDRLITDWHGQTRVELPGHVVATRSDGSLWFSGASAIG